MGPLQGEVFNFNPETGKPDEAFGASEWSRVSGRLSFIKWLDPGGPGYDPTFPCDRPNRVLTVQRVRDGKRQWREYNLTSIRDGKERWQGPSHHWIEAEHDFAAVGRNRPGLVLFRKDINGYVAGEGNVRILEFFVPNDAADAVKAGLKPKIYMRWTTELVGAKFEKREVPIHVLAFEETNFVITQVTLDA